jgi:hypothetical protein
MIFILVVIGAPQILVGCHFDQPQFFVPSKKLVAEI